MSDRAFIGTRKGLFTVQRTGSPPRWKVTAANFLGDEIPIVMHDRRDGAVYAALHHGHFGDKLHRSEDGGATWTEIGAPAFPPKPADEPDWLDPNRNEVIPWAIKLIWSLTPGGPDQPGTLWCGTIPGGLFRSNDRGQSWSLVETLCRKPERRGWFGGGADYPGIHSICVDPRNSRHLTLGISCGGAWRTTDNGETWSPCAEGMRAEYMPPEKAYEQNIQDPHLVVQCAAQPQHFWAQHHNGIFRSTSGCEKWDEIRDVKPSVFGFAVAVHPQHGDTAWFIPAIKDEKRIPADGRVVVTRTRDGGKSFDILRDGLPQEHAYDLVFRHALDIDPAGERLLFGSTTGSVWVSENAGDSWQAISTHLPPVYCVRMA